MPLQLDPETVKNSPKFRTEAMGSLFGRLKGETEDKTKRKEDHLKTLSLQHGVDQKIRRSLASDIYPIPDIVNPDRRASCEHSAKLFAETYFPWKFDLRFSDEHEDLIRSMDESLLDSEGLLCYAFPRGSGKSTLAEILCVKSLLYGQRRFVVLISAEGKASAEAFQNISSEIRYNELLLEDFPEICYPIMMTEGNSWLAKHQHVHGKPTHISIRADMLTLPLVEGSKVGGSVIRCASIMGRIRGLKHNIPNGKTIRPDLVVIDDPQTDKVAKSLTQVNIRERIINGTIRGLAGPGKPLTILMPCTVIQSNDLADRFLDRNKKPEWRGKKSKLVRSFPTRMDLWHEYWKIKCDSYRNGGKGIEATDFYLTNREEMDAGSDIPWMDRFTPPIQVSALQHAMDLYFKDPITFFSEYQNEPLPESVLGEVAGRIELKPELIQKRWCGLDRGVCPQHALHITTGIDIQQRILYYLTVAWTEDFGGTIIDYGAFPKQPIEYYRTADPPVPLDYEKKDLRLGPLIFYGLEELRAMLPLYKVDNTYDYLSNQKVFIDANWSLVTDAIYGFCKQEEKSHLFHPVHGRGIGAVQLPMSDWPKKLGEKKSDYNWVERQTTNVKNRGRHVIYDTNYWKSLVADRLIAPKGSPNALLIYGQESTRHELLCDHLCAEHPIIVSSRGRTIDEWKIKPGISENHWWDCLVMAAVASCYLGMNPHNIVVTEDNEMKSKVAPSKKRRVAADPPKRV
jgi:hypothetical protein